MSVCVCVCVIARGIVGNVCLCAHVRVYGVRACVFVRACAHVRVCVFVCVCVCVTILGGGEGPGAEFLQERNARAVEEIERRSAYAGWVVRMDLYGVCAYTAAVPDWSALGLQVGLGVCASTASERLGIIGIGDESIAYKPSSLSHVG